MLLRRLFRFVPHDAFHDALAHLHRGDYEIAARRFDALLEEASPDAADLVLYAAEAHIEAGKQFVEAGDIDAALLAFERAATLRPRYADVQHMLGQLYERSGRPLRARRAYERALEINPRYLEARLALARLLVQLQEVREAHAHLQAAWEAGGGSASRELEELLHDPGEPFTEPAGLQERLEALCADIQRSRGSSIATAIDAARGTLRAGDAPQAIRILKDVLKAQPSYPDLHNLLGVAYDSADMPDDAIEEFETALSLAPEYDDARLNLGLTLFARGHHRAAERHLRWLESRRPGHEIVRRVLAQIPQEAP